MSVVVMPRLADGMEEGTLLQWLVEANSPVAIGDEIAEIETDKATMSLEAEAEGLLYPLAAEGATVPVGTVIAHVLTDGEAPPPGYPANVADGDTPHGGAPEQRAVRPASPRSDADTGQTPSVRASPLARRIAAANGVQLSTVSGTGANGRIVRRDVEKAASSTPDVLFAPAVASAASEPTDPRPAEAAVQVVELTNTQKLVARRMSEAKATIPDFSVSVDVDMGACADMRASLSTLKLAATPSYNDMIVRASALALREHPKANGSYRDGRIEINAHVNVGFAVAAENSLVVPVIREADTKSLGAIAVETRSLAAQVRAGTVTPASLAGGTFTVSNLGMFGVDRFTAIINAPQAAILAVGALRETVVHRSGEFVVSPMLTLTLVCDHRILYGADAAAVLRRIQELLETPAGFVL